MLETIQDVVLQMDVNNKLGGQTHKCGGGGKSGGNKYTLIKVITNTRLLKEFLLNSTKSSSEKKILQSGYKERYTWLKRP